MATLAARTLLAGDSMGFQNRVELATTLIVRSSTQVPPAAPVSWPAARRPGSRRPEQ